MALREWFLFLRFDLAGICWSCVFRQLSRSNFKCPGDCPKNAPRTRPNFGKKVRTFYIRNCDREESTKFLSAKCAAMGIIRCLSQYHKSETYLLCALSRQRRVYNLWPRMRKWGLWSNIHILSYCYFWKLHCFSNISWNFDKVISIRYRDIDYIVTENSRIQLFWTEELA